MKLQQEFTLALAVIYLVGFCFFGGLFYFDAQSNARQESLREARVVLATATAIREYTVDQIRPLIVKLPNEETFHRESVPSYAAQEVFRRINETYPHYTYREVALNPTNLNDLPSAWEVGLIQEFRNDENLTELSGTRETQKGPFFYLSQPIRITNPACLECHSTPENAPDSLLNTYGINNGFNWQLNEVVGIKITSVLKSEAVQRMNSEMLWLLVALSSVSIAIFLVIIVLLNRSVIIPMAKITQIAEDLSLGKVAAKMPTQSNQEFVRCGKAIERLHRSMQLAMENAATCANEKNDPSSKSK